MPALTFSRRCATKVAVAASAFVSMRVQLVPLCPWQAPRHSTNADWESGTAVRVTLLPNTARCVQMPTDRPPASAQARPSTAVTHPPPLPTSVTMSCCSSKKRTVTVRDARVAVNVHESPTEEAQSPPHPAKNCREADAASGPSVLAVRTMPVPSTTSIAQTPLDCVPAIRQSSPDGPVTRPRPSLPSAETDTRRNAANDVLTIRG